MTDEEFISLLDELGGETAGWPSHRQKEAMALLEHSARARTALKAMQEAERFLALSSSPAVSIDCAAIAARATRHDQSRRQAARSVMGPGLRKASFGALGVLALAAGVLVGMTPPSGTAIVGSVQTALNGGGNDVW
ncbi:MAG TPA: hypothetical protein VGG66_02365 [Rhizomicrobium sp.]